MTPFIGVAIADFEQLNVICAMIVATRSMSRKGYRDKQNYGRKNIQTKLIIS